MNLSTTSVLLFLLSHNVAADTSTSTSTLRGGQSDNKASSNINNNQYQRELPPAWKTRGCKIDGEKIGIYIGGGIGKFMIYSLCTSCVPILFSLFLC